MPPIARPKLLPLAIAALLSGCAVTRVEPPPPAPAPVQFKEDAGWQRARAAAPVPDDWWTLFGDPLLDDLERRLVIGNENLQIAAAQLASLRATLDASKQAVYPTVTANLGATRSGSVTGSAPSGGARTANSVSLSASASWETDLWGRLRMAQSGAEANEQASADDLALARLSAQATLAQTYFSLRTADAQLALYERTVQAYRKTLALTQDLFEAGVDARSAVLQARTQLETAQSQLAAALSQRAQDEHAIAVLLGIAPSELDLARQAGLPAVPDLPELLPATLLERRPDIAAAERRVAAAYAAIGQADAAWFPDLTLSAGLGYRSPAFAKLLSAPNLFWSLGPSIAQAVLDGGQRRLASAQARASAEQATAVYRQTVLTAFQEVEDSLVAARQLAQQAQHEEQALQAAQQTLELVLLQYRSGSVSYLNVVAAQTSALGAESSLLAIRNSQLAAVNVLLKNIAGRWQAEGVKASQGG
ncbi:MAG: efflux transporter outer membrane subunit [Burkholderiales bacterium]|nr:efflux transporter outer membrane subunit [Burkholderiales bacterium]